MNQVIFNYKSNKFCRVAKHIKVACCFLLFFLPLVLSGQDKSTFDFGGGLGFSNRHIIEEKFNARSLFRLGVRSSEVGGLGSQISIGVSDQIAKDVHVEIGLMASFPRFRSFNLWNIEVDAKHKFFFFEFPFAFRYEYIQGKFTPYVKLGGALSVYGSSTTEFVNNISSNDPYVDAVNLAHFDVLIGAGYDYSIHSDLDFFFEFNCRYGLTPIWTDHSESEHLYSFGVGFGVRRVFSLE